MKGISPSPRRPFLVTLLALVVLSISGCSLLRLALTLSQWQFLAGFDELSPLYLALSGLCWFIAGAWIGIGLWRCQPGSARSARLFSIGYVFYIWVDRLLLHRFPIHDNWFFPVLLTMLWLALTFWATRKVRDSFSPANS